MLVRGASELAYLASSPAGTSLVLANLPSPRTGQPGRAHVLIPSLDGADLAWEPATDPCLSHDVPGRITCAHALRIARHGMREAPAPPISMWARFAGDHRAWLVEAEGYTDDIATPFPTTYPCFSGTSSFLINATTGKLKAFGYSAWNVPCPSG